MKNRRFITLIALLLAVLMLGGCAVIDKPNDDHSADQPDEQTDTQGETEADVHEEEPTEPVADDEPEASLFTYEKLDDGTAVLTAYTGTEKAVTTPDTIDGLKVSAIGESCFAGNVHVEKVHVSEGVITLGDYSFECCSMLKKIYLPDSLETVGNGAFSGCCSLYLVDIQDGVKSIGDGAFLECTSLVSFIAPASLETAGDFAFANCTSLVKVDFKNSALSAVSDRMFYYCTALSTVRLPEGIQSVGKRAFSHNVKIMYIYLPDSVESISESAFEFCSGLQNFSVPCDVIEPYTFYCCSSLSYVNFPETLKSIGERAFGDIELNTEDLEIPESAVVAGNAFGFNTEEYYGSDHYGDSSDSGDGIAEMPTFADITAAEIEAKANEDGYRTVSRGEFPAWSDEYLEFNKDNALLDGELNPYISKYKGEISYYYVAMTAVASGEPAEIENAKAEFGDDFVPMYTMIDHGLATEMRRFRMKDDMLLYTGVYDFQLKTAAGSDHIPTLDELKSLVGTTFTDPCLTSTTTEAEVAFGFSDTLFVIYAPAENMNALGAVCMDSYMHTFENEILLASGATYEVLDAGVMSAVLTDWDGNETIGTRNYVFLKLINE